MLASERNAKRRNKVLFDIDCIIDWDLTIINYYKHHQNKLDSKQKEFINQPMADIKWMRMYGDIDQLDELGADIAISKVDLIPYAITTSMETLYKTYNGYNVGTIIKAKIRCNDEIEAQFIKKRMPRADVLIAPRSKVHAGDYTRIILMNARDALEYINDKVIDYMICNVRLYMDKEMPEMPPRDVALLLDIDDFTIAKMYTDVPDAFG